MINYILSVLKEEKLVDVEEKEIIEYGMTQGIITLIMAVFIILIGALIGVFTESIIFLISFIPLRIFAGGYHADTQLRCAMITISIVIGSFLCFKNLNYTDISLNVLCLIGFIVIFALAPLESNKKPLEVIECIVYKKNVRKILCFEYVVFVIAQFCHMITISKVIMISFLLVSTLLLLGVVKYKM